MTTTTWRDPVTGRTGEVTNGAAHVNVQNAAITTQELSLGNPISIAGGVSQSLGDLSIYGLPFGDVILDPSGSTDSFAGAYAVGNGRLVIQITRTGTTDTVSITAVCPDGVTAMAGPFGVVTTAGALATSMTTGLYYMYFGSGAVS